MRYPDQPQDYAGHENAVLAALPEQQTYVVLGESFSGPIAVSIAGRSPPGLLGFILCSSFLSCPRRVLNYVRPLLGLVPPQYQSTYVIIPAPSDLGPRPIAAAAGVGLRRGPASSVTWTVKPVA